MRRGQRRLLAFRLAKAEIKRLGVPRSQLNRFVKMYMREMLQNPQNFVNMK